jgi:hypothetical protein
VWVAVLRPRPTDMWKSLVSCWISFLKFNENHYICSWFKVMAIWD